MSTATTHIKTEKQLVPELRFKEFEEYWIVNLLGDTCTVKTGGKDTQDRIDDGLFPFFVRSNTVERINSYSFDGEAILTSGDGVGVGKNFHYINGKFDYHQRVYALRDFKEDFSGKFIYQVFVEKFYKRVMRLSAKNSVDSVRMNMITEMKMHFPSLPEQHKIASFLSAVDEKIQQLTKKKALLEQYKKGVMQQLFSGQLRFKDENGNPYPDWEEKLLGKLIEICSSKRVLQEDWKDEGVPFLRTREIINLSNNVGFKTPIFISEELFGELKDKYGVPKSGDILATGVGTIGQLYVVNQTDKFYFKDGNVLWFKMNDSLDSNYLNQLFKTRFIRKQLSDNASITTVATFTIDGARKTKIIYPCLEEQQKIATYLSSIDTKIESVNNQITQTQTFKKGLLQQMFV